MPVARRCRCAPCLDWFVGQGDTTAGILGTSLGSCYAWRVLDLRIRAVSSIMLPPTLPTKVWHGQSTVIFAGLNPNRFDHLRVLWSAIKSCPIFHNLRDAVAHRVREI
jgi:hypothetical protein